MEKIRLGDIATTITKGTTPTTIGFPFVDTGINFVKIESIDEAGNFLPDRFAHITDECNRKLGRSKLEENDILFSIAGAIGRTAIVTKSILPANTNQALAIIRIPSNAINLQFVLYALQSQAVAEQSAKQKQGVAQLNLSLKNIADIQIPLVSSEKQAEIVRILAALDVTIGQRKEQIKFIDQLVKSRFIELFGDPERNPKKWPVVSITEIIQGKVSNGFFAKRNAYRTDGNVQVLGVANIVNRMYSNIEGLPRTNATQAEKEKYRVNYGDMLFCRSSLVAEGIGKASIVPQDTPQNVLFECHVIRLPLDLQKCVPEFVQTLSTTPYFRKQIIAQSKTATMTTIGQDGILKAAIILPPVELQQEFLRFVKQTDKSKYYSSLSFRYCQVAANTYRQEWMTCRTSDF